MTNYKQLCAELVELGSSPARSVSELAERMSQVMDLADRARAALAESEPDGLPVWTEAIYGDGAVFLKDGVMVPIEEVVRELNRGAQARAVLAHRGSHPGSPDSSGNLKAGLTRSPDAGEVAELVAVLRADADCITAEQPDLMQVSDQELRRAADLLERLSPPRLAAEPPPPEQGQAFKDADTGVIYVRDGDQWLATQPVPQPVPVSERLPELSDLDENGRCWVYQNQTSTTHWLPAHALPLLS